MTVHDHHTEASSPPEPTTAMTERLHGQSAPSSVGSLMESNPTYREIVLSQLTEQEAAA